MALSITANTVKYVSGSTSSGVLASDLAQGKVVRRTGNGNEVDASSKATLDDSDFAGMLLNTGVGGSIKQPVTYATDGAVVQFTSVPPLAIGETYVLDTAGDIMPIGDLLTGDFVTHVGVCKVTDQLTITKNVLGVAKP